MAKVISVGTTTDYLQRIANVKAETGIAELVWNALDADANNVYIMKSDIYSNEKIIVTDDGCGMLPEKAEQTFSRLGNSWKKQTTHTSNGRALHGQKGTGRYKAFALGRAIDWHSTFKNPETAQFMDYKISMLADNLQDVAFSDLTQSSQKKAGTIVEISDLNNKGLGLDLSDLENSLTLIFANYLFTYPSVNIYLNGQKIDPQEEVESKETLSFTLPDIDGEHEITIIFWKQLTAKDIYICKKDGAVLDGFNSKKIKTLGVSFSAYVNSPLIDELNSYADVSTFEMEDKGKILLGRVIQEINNCLKNKKHQEHLDRVEQWKREGIYPYEYEQQSNINQIEQNVFDIVATNVEEHLPKFKNADTQTKKFTFKLLSQALSENPETMQKILTEVLALSIEDQKILANLLEKTTLSSIIKSAKIVADRLNFLEGLEELLFDPDNKQALLERDQLHKILENESWIFGEQYHLTGSEQGLKKVLDKHIDMLGKRSDIDTTTHVEIDGKSNGRIDLMLHKKIEVRAGEFDYLVVELKRPKQKINQEIISQIKAYADAVAHDERFDKSRCRWTFIAISNEFDRIAELESQQNNAPKGQIWAVGNIEVYIFKWSEIINNAKARLKFYREQLNYAADDESSRKYLEEIHTQYLPATYKKD